MTIPLDASGLNFRAELGLGRPARAFYSVKQLKTVFRAGFGPNFFCRLQDLSPRPSSKVRGRAWRGSGQRAGPGSKCSSILGTLREGSSQPAPLDEPTVQFLHASDDWKKQNSK
jgi:hypothetical protein